MTNRLRKGMLPLAIASLLAASPVVMAQNVTSSAVTGVVVNAQGQPVTDATVTIVHVPSGTTKTVVTNASGRYNAKGMRVGGPYEISVTKAGETRGERDDVYLQLGQTSAINLVLNPTAENAQKLGAVTVTANELSRIFSPDHKGISTNISERELDMLPTPGRSIQNIVRLDPRVVISNRNQGKISALGQNFRYNNITIDSVGANDPYGLNPNGLPVKGSAISQDTIAAYNISTADYDVATRRGLGVSINAVTKSGTNEFHGSLYYVFQNADMIGDNGEGNPFTAYDKDTTAGFTLGGPIIKDKLFFFGSFEQSERTGGATAWGPEGSAASNTIDGLTQQQVQQIRDIAAGYGLTNLGGSSSGGKLLEDKRYLIKLDWNISDNQRASFTWRKTDEHEPRPSNGGDDNFVLSSAWTTLDTDNESYAFHLYSNWSDNFASTTSLSYAHFHREGGPFNGVDMPSITVHTEHYYDPSVSFGTDHSYQANRIDAKTWFGSWAGTWFAGDHAFKFGLDYQKDDKYNLFLQNYFGEYSFDSIQDFATGTYSEYNYARPADGLGIADVAASFSISQLGFFLQDTWQVTPQLSVLYGFRIDKISNDDKPLYNSAFAQAGFTTPEGTLLTTNQYNLDGESIIQPRVSFNYQFDSERLMQLRGGFGLFISNPPAVWVGNIYTNAGVNQVTFECVTRYGCNPPLFSPDPYNQPDAQGQPVATVNTVDPNFSLPSSWKYSLGFDMQLPWMGMIATIDWQHIDVENGIWYQALNIGAPTGVLPDGRNTYYKLPQADDRASGQEARYNANPAFSNEILNLASTSEGKADNITLQFKKPFSDNWSAMVGLSWDHTTDVNPGQSSVAISNWRQNIIANPNENVASTSSYQTEWRLIASVAWRHAFFGNYYTSFSAFYDGHTGRPYSWVFYDDANGDGSYGNDLVYIPERGGVEFTPGTSQALIDSFYDYIENNDYLNSHQGQIAKRNGDRAPWFNQLDLSVSQEIPGIFDGNKGEIRLDVYNFLNLLNKKWGTETVADFPGARVMAEYSGVDPTTGKYIYDIGYYTDANGNYKPDTLNPDTYPNDRAQRWAVQLTVRYRF